MSRLSYLIGLLIGMTFSQAIASMKDTYPGSDDKKKDKWVMVWEDNFEKDGYPDKAVWDYEEGYIRNRELQYYTRERLENARVENGFLVIEARKDNWEGKEITSASLHTYGKKSMLYGRIEVRAKLPTGLGTWPAIWMLGDNFRKGTHWPDCGEIDIMENVGYDPQVIHANIHTKAYNHVKGTGKGNKITAEKPWEDFHIYAVEWYEDRMEFYFDDRCYFTYENEGNGFETWPFDQPHYLILNLAIGGAWGGQKGVDDKIFPQKYYIDYVKVFRQKK